MIFIYCDGGLANRFASLISGMSLARIVNKRPMVVWPLNNHCLCPLEVILEPDFDISSCNLTELVAKETFELGLFHDHISATAAKMPFRSAYQFPSLENLVDEVSSKQQSVLLYPALIIEKLGKENIHASIQALRFKKNILDFVRKYILVEIGGPFYSIHLRNTDIKCGYKWTELVPLIENQETNRFFLCSDDRMLERRFVGFSNVSILEKSSYQEKLNSTKGWNMPGIDDVGRPTNSNIYRSADSVQDALKDFLILSQGNFMFQSSSTFYSMAKVFGEALRLSPFDRPVPLEYVSVLEVRKILQKFNLSIDAIKSLCVNLQVYDRRDEAIILLEEFSQSSFTSDSDREWAKLTIRNFFKMGFLAITGE
jgi:hypothetical protein